jgi:hypothetical protein
MLYLTNLNPRLDYGLNHQLWCIVKGLMIGHYVGRDIVVNGFFPDYNHHYHIPIEQIIDIDKTNERLIKAGFNSKIVINDLNIEWKQSKYQNPFLSEFVNHDWNKRFVNMIHALKKESKENENYNLDILTTFIWPVMYYFRDNQILHNQLINIFCQLVFSTTIQNIVKQTKIDCGLDNLEYHSCHMRLENDWVEHITKKYNINNKHLGKPKEEYSQEIFEIIFSYIKNTDKKIFIATGLGKSDQENNFLLEKLLKIFPSKICISKNLDCWKNLFPGTKFGRELNGLIDLIICLDSKQYLGGCYSSFSETIKLVFNYNHKKIDLFEG